MPGAAGPFEHVETHRAGRDLVGRGLASQVVDLVAQVVGHEMGHALGILLHSPDSRDLMARVIRVGAAGDTLTAADRHTFQQASYH